jgi:DNA-binding CsgD family transcriptional regulator
MKVTRRELQVITLAAEGLSAQEIADNLYCSVRTVNHHLGSLYARYGCHSRMRAVHLATAAGLVAAPETQQKGKK